MNVSFVVIVPHLEVLDQSGINGFEIHSGIDNLQDANSILIKT